MQDDERIEFERLLVLLGVKREPRLLIGLLGGIGFRFFADAVAR